MAEIKIICDCCIKEIDALDSIYCEKCLEELEAEIKELQFEVS